MITRNPQLPILTLAIRNEADIVLVRQRARIVAELLGFETVDQTRIATAVSEIARNALAHGGGGTARFAAGGRPPGFQVVIEDRGPGMSVPEERPARDRHARTGAGLRLARQLMDDFEIGSPPRGSAVLMSKHLPEPAREVKPDDVRALVEQLMSRPPESLLEELSQQHQELLAVLGDLTRQQASLREANAELEETNRGVMALYSEVTRELDETNRGVLALYSQLDDQTGELRRVNALKDRFLSHLSHEFRTPLISTLALSRLLADHVDGPLTDEQAVQVGFIREGAADLLAMVNELLDVAKIEAGRMDLRVEEFAVDELVGTLRGVFRPLAAEAGIALEIGDPPRTMPHLRTDRGRLAQILRNLMANAIQHTTEGSVGLEVAEDGDEAVFTVRDTGVGLAPEDLEGIFQEFVQAPPARRRSGGGTGLGLPIARRLAGLLGGEISAESELGRGSAFRVRIPLRLPAPAEALEDGGGAARTAPGGRAAGASGERQAAAADAGSREAPSAASRPKRPDEEGAGGAGAAQPRREGDPDEPGEDAPLVLVIDDDDASRYMVEHTLRPAGCRVVHARTGEEGLAKARAERPAAIFLDLGLPDASGFDLLGRLQEGGELPAPPVIVYTCRELDRDQVRALSGFPIRIVRKSDPGLFESISTIGDALVRLASPGTEERGP